MNKSFHVLQRIFRRNLNSKSWIDRRLNDRYVELAKTDNYRCRSAYKLLEIDKRYKIIHPGLNVIDLGASPGSWTQVLVRKTNADGKDQNKPKGTVISVDRQPIYPIPHATIFSRMDFTLKSSREKILKTLGTAKLHLVVSDMAPNATGVKTLDQDAIIALAESALNFAISTSAVTCLVKIWDGSGRNQIEKQMLNFYHQLNHVRPMATQTESSEMFLLARGFKDT